MHERGEAGLKKSEAGAAALYRLAAAAGFNLVLFNLGCYCRDGSGVPQDHAEAARLWLQAADTGLADAEAALARAYMLGVGVEKDYGAALRYARRSADNYVDGEYLCGRLYVFGFGVQRDVLESIKWYVKAAAQGSTIAIKDLQVIAADGVPEAAAALRRLRFAP